MRDWYVRGFDAEAWDAVKETITTGEFTDKYSDFFGGIMCGAVCFDIVLRDIDEDEWLLCADPYVLGIDNGYGFSRKNHIPYDEFDGFCFVFDTSKSFEETIADFLRQIDDYTDTDRLLSEYASKTDVTWRSEESDS